MEADKDIKERISLGAISKNDVWKILMEEKIKVKFSILKKINFVLNVIILRMKN
jgi:hypothetical protein